MLDESARSHCQRGEIRSVKGLREEFEDDRFVRFAWSIMLGPPSRLGANHGAGSSDIRTGRSRPQSVRVTPPISTRSGGRAHRRPLTRRSARTGGLRTGERRPRLSPSDDRRRTSTRAP